VGFPDRNMWDFLTNLFEVSLILLVVLVGKSHGATRLLVGKSQIGVQKSQGIIGIPEERASMRGSGQVIPRAAGDNLSAGRPKSMMRASRSTHHSSPLQPASSHVRVNSLPEDFLDGSALLDGKQLEALPARFG
jgi:hypothetical protein